MSKCTDIKSLLIIGTIFLSAPALADEARKPVGAQDAMRQETVTLGDNRFIIFSGTAGGNGQYGYTADSAKIEGGIPHFDPLFIEEYDADNNLAKLEYGVAFQCLSYRFDKSTKTLAYTMLDSETGARMQFTYALDVDIFKLQQVIVQTPVACPKEPCPMTPPKTVFKAIANAQTH